MAQNAAIMGLLEELGLTGQSPQAAYQQGLFGNMPNLGSGSVGAFANAGMLMGRSAAPAIGGLAMATSNKIKGEDFSFSQGVRDFRDDIVAGQLGFPDVETYRAHRSTQTELRDVNVASTGDPIKDQLEYLKAIIAIANKNGDARTAGRAVQKQAELKAQELAMRKAEAGAGAAELAREQAEESDMAGRTVRMVGDARDGPVSTAVYDDDTGQWTVNRPNGTVLQNVDPGQFYFVKPDGTIQRDRKFETPTGSLMDALQVNGLGGQTVNKIRGNLKDMGEQAEIINDMTKSLLNMYNPAVAFAESRGAAVAADRTISLVETISSLFTRTGDDASRITYNDKAVSAAKQYELGTDTELLTNYLASQGKTIRDILPEHIQADTREAQLFQSNVMQMAYLDARLQEPANRGLSDSDIERALQRIGVGTPDPMVFVGRQRQIINRLNNKLDSLGAEFGGTGDWPKQRLIDHVYQPELRTKISEKLGGATATLDAFVEKFSPPTVEAPAAAADLPKDEAALIEEYAKSKGITFEKAREELENL